MKASTQPLLVSLRLVEKNYGKSKTLEQQKGIVEIGDCQKELWVKRSRWGRGVNSSDRMGRDRKTDTDTVIDWQESGEKQWGFDGFHGFRM